ncbi:MFS transporter [Spiribacter halobius]|uniref:MFS transporter n=1 Tax=Sediminicurvatus halobius TaxID=2182432 RepID=A0A2U2MY22_9GAMM|nr:MFS transporter [Spiribacter halobius]PWG61846.1 MFS transporter [Spiribacter halobius]UEX77689.1 MFS transporter [Spiribacter halobius]
MGRFITALGIGQFCAWGTLYYSFPQIAEAMGAELGWSKAERYLAPTLTLIVAAVSAMPVGIAIDRGHGRLVMSLGALAAGLLLLAWSRVETLAGFYAVFAALGIVHAATLYDAAFAVVARHTGPERARRGITLLTLWGGFASTVFIPLVELMLSRWDWRMCVATLAVVPIALCAPLNAYAIRSLRDSAPVASTGREKAIARAPLRWALAKPTYWALAVVFIAHAGVFSGFTYHAYPLLQEFGLGAGSVVGVLALIGPAQVAGRLALHLAPAGPSIATLGVGASGLTFLVFITLALAPTSVALAGVLAIVYGAANGVMTIVRGMAVPALLTRHAYGRVTASLIAPATVTKAAAPAAAAMLWGLTQGYGPVLLALALGSAVLTLAFWAAAVGSRTRHSARGDTAGTAEV